MTPLIALPAHPLLHGLVHALGWTLLHLCWQAAIVAVMLWCVLRMLSGQSSQIRYMAACSALALMVVLPLLTFARLASAEYKLALASRTTTIVIDPGMFLRVGLDGPVAPWPIRIAAALDHSVPWLLLLWFAGVVVFVARLNLGLIAARRMKSAETHAPPDELQQLFQSLRIRLGIVRAVQLMHSALVQVPTVIGWLRPVVLIPASCLTGLSPEQIEAILCHELAHVRRHDYLVSVFQSVVEALLFYHPAVWWVSKQVRLERECCCDELAVSIGGDALAYAKALSHLEVHRSFYPEIAVAANGGVLTMRIKRLLGCKQDSPSSQLAAVMLLALLVIAAGATVSELAHAQNNSTQPYASSSNSAQTPKTNVTPIISEKAAPILRTLAQADVPQPVVPAVAHANPIRVSPGVLQGYLIKTQPVVYPAEAKAKHVEGMVIMHALISKEGTIENLEVISGPELLRQGAKDAVMRWKYRPYVLNGVPTEVETTINVNFTFAKDTTGQDKALYDNGLKAIQDGRYEVARLALQTIVNTYPDSPYVARAQEAIADSWQKQGVTPPKDTADAADDAQFVPVKVAGGNDSLPAALAHVEPLVPLRKIGGSVSAPTILTHIEPQYTPEARAAKVTGVVLVNLTVDEQGIPRNVRVLRGVGMGLDERAVEAVKQYRFNPAMEDGKPVPVAVNVQVNFQFLDSKGQAINPQPDGAGTGLQKIVGGVSTPVVIYQVSPEYSKEAKKAKTKGIVLVNLIVDPHGLPQNVHVLHGIGHGLDEKAVEAVKQYKFKPAMKDGKPVAVELNIEVNFQIF